jgi:hypothetical protein
MAKGKKKSILLMTVCLLVGLSFSWDLIVRPAMSLQLGGLLKKKVKSIVQQPDADASQEATAASSSSDNSNSRFNDRVLELNEQTLAKLEKTLKCEQDFRDGVDAKYAKLPTQAQYQQCTMDVMLSPEGQGIAQAGISDMQAMQQQSAKLTTLLEKKCGKNPSAYNKSDDLKPAAAQCSSAGGLTLDQYAIAKERIIPFCNSGGQEKVRGVGNLYYVYTPAEVNAMKSKCSQILSLIQSKP